MNCDRNWGCAFVMITTFPSGSQVNDTQQKRHYKVSRTPKMFKYSAVWHNFICIFSHEAFRIIYNFGKIYWWLSMALGIYLKKHNCVWNRFVIKCSNSITMAWKGCYLNLVTWRGRGHYKLTSLQVYINHSASKPLSLKASLSARPVLPGQGTVGFLNLSTIPRAILLE